MKPVNPGKMDQHIVIQKYTVKQDPIGNEIAFWEDELSLWAQVNNLYGVEYWAAAGQGQEDTIVFTVRWSRALDRLAKDKQLTRYQLLFRNAPYEIKGYDNSEYKNKLVKIRAVSK